MRDTKELIQYLHNKFGTLDPYELADAMNIYVFHADMGTTRGLCYTARRIKQIYLNYGMPKHIERFVLAHEIGHLMMHPNYNTPFLHSTFFSVDKFEMEANKFAVDLIISDEDLEAMYEYSTDSLATHYGLPREIIELRFR